MTSFVHLDVHSDLSDGLDGPAALVAAAVADGHSAVALTDLGSLAGIHGFVKAARKAGIKPIIGAEMRVAIGDRRAPRRVAVKDPASAAPDAGRPARSKTFEPLIVLAANRTGWTNLLALHNAATLESDGLTDLAHLAAHADGLLFVTGGLTGPVAGRLLNGDRVGAEGFVRALVQLAGSDRVFVAIPSAASPAIRDQLRTLASNVGVRTVATNSVRHGVVAGRTAHSVKVANAAKRTLNDPSRLDPFVSGGFHLRTAVEMRTVHDAGDCDATLDVAALVNDDVLPVLGHQMPLFPGVADEATALRAACARGLTERFGAHPAPPVTARLDHELAVIDGMGFEGFFLTVAEIVTWARSKGISVGPGRGSAAASLVSFALGITTLDPLAHDLLFERFLNPDRVSLPDIDLDFESARRSEVFDHIVSFHGQALTARVGAFGRFKARAAIETVARTLGLARSVADAIKAALPTGFNAPLADASPAVLDAVRAAHPSAPQVLDLAVLLDGSCSSVSPHPAGIVITPRPVAELVPLRVVDGVVTTENTMDELAEIGLVKFDVLGLKTLDLVKAAGWAIDRAHGPDWRAEFDSLLDDASASRESTRRLWSLLAAGDTDGVFQLEQERAQELAREVAPRTFADLIALIALNRPGPLGIGAHHTFADRLNGRAPVSFDSFTDDPDEQAVLAELLVPTQGVIVFQETVMQVAVRLGGFTMAEADGLRAAVAKKDAEKMAPFADAWPARLAERGFSAKLAASTWEAMAKFAQYGFGKAHAAVYGILTLQTAWLKASFPTEFAAAALKVAAKEKRPKLFVAARRSEIEVTCPDVNVSMVAPTVAGARRIVLGLGDVAGLSDRAAHRIVDEREADGSFASFGDFCSRLDGAVTPVELDQLILAGALDQFGPRLGLLKVACAPTVAPLPVEFEFTRRSALESQVLGGWFSHLPTEGAEDVLAAAAGKLVAANGAPLVPLAEIGVAHGGRFIVTAGAVVFDTSVTKTGKRILKGTIQTADGVLPVIGFGKLAEQLDAAPVKPGPLFAIHGRAEVIHEADDGDASVRLVVDRMLPVTAPALASAPPTQAPVVERAPQRTPVASLETVTVSAGTWPDRRLAAAVFAIGEAVGVGGAALVSQVGAICADPDELPVDLADGRVTVQA